MCQAKPHGRCAADTRPVYQAAREAVQNIMQTKQDLILNGDPAATKEYKEALAKAYVARLVYTATPEGLKKSQQRIEEHNGSDSEIAQEAKFYEDALALRAVNNRNVARFFADSTYIGPDGKTVVAMPLSLTNIPQVNEWVASVHRELPPLPVATDEETEEDLNDYLATERAKANGEEEEEKPVKTNVKIYNQKGQLHIQKDGKTYSLTEKAYLIKNVGEKDFTLVSANKFEKEYTSSIEKHEPPFLNTPGLEKVFPSTILSDYIVLNQSKNKA